MHIYVPKVSHIQVLLLIMMADFLFPFAEFHNNFLYTSLCVCVYIYIILKVQSFLWSMADHWIWIVLHKLWTFCGERNYEHYMFSQDKVIVLLNILMLPLLILFAQPHWRVSWCHGLTSNFTKIPVNDYLGAPEIWKHKSI